MRQPHLTPEQTAAVNAEGRRLLLVAPAGSGKTEVLVRRIERILLQSPEQSFRVLGVTYTVKASEELRTRTTSTVSSEAWRVDCETLHGFALEWLKRYGRAVGIGPDVVVYSDDVDRMALVADYLRSLGLEHQIGGNLQDTVGPIIRAIDNQRTLLSKVSTNEAPFLGIDLSELTEAYVTALTLAGGIDFPGMLTKLLDVFQVDPWTLENFQATYREILVDEGQDLTPVQAQVLDMLAGQRVNLFVVADDRQSINRFAGGSFENALTLVGSEHSHLTLQHNFRCSSQILATAERVAANMKSRNVETLTAPGAPAGEVILTSCSDESDEARRVVDWINSLLQNGLNRDTLAPGEDPTVSAEDIAVIARARWILDPCIRALTEAGHKLSLNVEPSGFLRTATGRIFLDALAILADVSDQPARRRFDDELEAMGVLERLGDPVEVLANSHLQELDAVAVRLRSLQDATAMDGSLSTLSQAFAGSTWQEDATAIEEAWIGYRTETAIQQRTLKRFLRYLGRSHLAKADDPGIRVLTIHRVKGLEFRAVGIVGVRQGALPDYRARTEDELDSERRGLYVAMTRAQRSLYVSWPESTEDRFGRSHSQQPSQFLREASLV